jgi:hypothetical protein
MLGSKSKFFSQSKDKLDFQRVNIVNLLSIKGYNIESVNVYLKAYDYFVENPSLYDGATIVKDLCDIPRLDLDAMLHDYHYIEYLAGTNFYVKWHADWLYAKGNERKGKGQYSSFSRFVGLTIIGIGFVPYANWKRGSVSSKQKQQFFEDYSILMN